MPAKNAREKDGFRDICDDCYPIIMGEKGYTLVNGIWYSKHSRPTQRAVELGDSAASQALSQPEVLSTQQVESTPAPIR